MIRPATHADLPRLLELGAQMHAESRYRVLAFSAARAERTLQMLLDSPNGFLWVAADGGAVTGGLAAMSVPHWASDDEVATDLALFVAPDARGGLTAARLVTRYREWARERGAVIVDMGVSTGVHPEQTARLLERLGARRIGFILEF